MTIPTEKFLTKQELLEELSKILPTKPCTKTIDLWVELEKFPMPSIPKPGGGRGTGKRTHRWFRLSDVLAWLESPADFYAQLGGEKKVAS